MVALALEGNHHSGLDLAAFDPLMNGDHTTGLVAEHPGPVAGEHLRWEPLAIADPADCLIIEWHMWIIGQSLRQRNDLCGFDLS